MVKESILLNELFLASRYIWVTQRLWKRAWGKPPLGRLLRTKTQAAFFSHIF